MQFKPHFALTNGCSGAARPAFDFWGSALSSATLPHFVSRTEPVVPKTQAAPAPRALPSVLDHPMDATTMEATQESMPATQTMVDFSQTQDDSSQPTQQPLKPAQGDTTTADAAQVPVMLELEGAPLRIPITHC